MAGNVGTADAHVLHTPMKTFCITMKDSLERQQRIKDQFPTVQFFQGFNGEFSGLQTTLTYEVDHPGSGYCMKPKSVGIWLSHYMLWQALSYMPDSHFLVLEDDAVCTDKARFLFACAQTPASCDFLFLGHCCTKDKPKRQIQGDIYEVKWPMCLHAYVVSKKVLPILVRELRRVWAPIDIQLHHEVFPREDVQTFCVLPRIMEQRGEKLPE